MANVIDTLLIALQLDTSKFSKGNKDAQDSLKKTRDEAEKHAKALQSEIGDKLTNAFEKATRRVIEFLAILAGASSLESFVQQTVNAGNALGLMAMSLGMNPTRLSAFEKAVERSGGTAEGAAASLKKLNDTRQAFKQSGTNAPDWMQKLGINLNAAQNGEDVLKQLVDNAKLQGRSETDFLYEAGTLGVDAGTARFAYEQGGSKGIDTAIDAQTGVAWTKAQIDAAERLRTAWFDASNTVSEFGRAVFRDVEPALTGFLKWLDEIIAKNGPALEGWVGDKIKDFINAIETTDWKSVAKSIDGYLDQVKAVKDGLGGWAKAGETLFEIWAGYKVLQVIAVISQLTGALTKLGTAGTLLGALAITEWLDPKDKAGTFIDKYVPGASWIDNLFSKIGLGKSYAEQPAQGNFAKDFIWEPVTSNIADERRKQLFGNMKGRGIRDVTENDPLPVKIVGGITSPLTRKATPEDASLPPPPPNGDGQQQAPDNSGGGVWGSIKKFFGGGSAASSPGGATSPDAGTLPVSGSTADLAKGLQAAYPHLTTGQCVELAQVMNGVGNVHDWRRGASVAETKPPIGTAVATFGNSGDSKLYAYGGNGTPGIGRDHAGIIAGYDKDGVTLLNQSAGQAPHYTHFPYGERGEHGGQNYFVINGPDDKPAGKNRRLLAPPIPKPDVATGARVHTHSAEHERISSAASNKASVQIGALNFHNSATGGQSNSIEEIMSRNLFISRADYGLA